MSKNNKGLVFYFLYGVSRERKIKKQRKNKDTLKIDYVVHRQQLCLLCKGYGLLCFLDSLYATSNGILLLLRPDVDPIRLACLFPHICPN